MPTEIPQRPVEPKIVDSGVHVRDSERAPATGAQMTLVAAVIVAILTVFFYGLNSQRNEATGPTAASTGASKQAENVPPPETQPKASTTGQAAKDAPNPKNPQGATRQQQPQKTEGQSGAQPQSNGGQNVAQPPTAPQPQKNQ